MINEDNVSHRQISADLSDSQVAQIKVYIQGAVYCWCKNCKDESDLPKWFSARALFGGENFEWEGTPLKAIYNWHENNGAEDPVNMAGRDVGHLLKEVLNIDRRKFDTRKGYTREYRWDINE